MPEYTVISLCSSYRVPVSVYTRALCKYARVHICLYGVHEVGETEQVRVCKRGGDIFSVCIPGNCSALLNNETSACM